MARDRTARQRQSGYAIAAVSFIGMIAMAGAATMMSTAPVAEVAEIERSLDGVRRHWGSVGMFAYAVSRGRQDGACSGTCGSGDATRAAFYQSYVIEIYNAKDNKNKLVRKNPTQRRWLYTELSNDHFYDIRTTVSVLNGFLSDGKLAMESTLAQVGDSLEDRNADTDQGDIRMELCTGLAAAGDACQILIPGSNTSGIARVQDFRVIRP